MTDQDNVIVKPFNSYVTKIPKSAAVSSADVCLSKNSMQINTFEILLTFPLLNRAERLKIIST